MENDAGLSARYLPERAFLVLGGVIYPLNKMCFTIGRHLDNDLVINDPSISRFHAEIQFKENQFILVDKNSTSGTFLNNKKINQNILFAGDIIVISKTPIMFMNEGASMVSTARKNTGQINLSDLDIETN